MGYNGISLPLPILSMSLLSSTTECPACVCSALQPAISVGLALALERGIKNLNVGTVFFHILSTQGPKMPMWKLLVFSSSSVVEFLPAHMGGLGSILSQGKKTSGDAGLIPGSGGSPQSRKWQPTPVFLSGKFPGERNLAGCSPWGHKESNTTDRLSTAFSKKVLERTSYIWWFGGVCQKVGVHSGLGSIRKQGW